MALSFAVSASQSGGCLGPELCGKVFVSGGPHHTHGHVGSGAPRTAPSPNSLWPSSDCLPRRSGRRIPTNRVVPGGSGPGPPVVLFRSAVAHKSGAPSHGRTSYRAALSLMSTSTAYVAPRVLEIGETWPPLPPSPDTGIGIDRWHTHGARQAIGGPDSGSTALGLVTDGRRELVGFSGGFQQRRSGCGCCVSGGPQRGPDEVQFLEQLLLRHSEHQGSLTCTRN